MRLVRFHVIGSEDVVEPQDEAFDGLAEAAPLGAVLGLPRMDQQLGRRRLVAADHPAVDAQAVPRLVQIGVDRAEALFAAVADEVLGARPPQIAEPAFLAAGNLVADPVFKLQHLAPDRFARRIGRCRRLQHVIDDAGERAHQRVCGVLALDQHQRIVVAQAFQVLVAGKQG